ncbi:MAG TPA: Hsp20/alpha crystallin family protein [Candidatus Acidoferrales bacterium]|nr:Hsp20/alpha crystallin family protein [Candidatus Acidoferrales bacterium]
MAEKTVPLSGEGKASSSREVTRSRERYIAPPVDIYETNEGLVLMADLPGVAKENLDVRVENDTLTIRGIASHKAPGSPIYREYELANFFRQFELGEKVDQGRISAELKHGVLMLSLPKAQEAKPRRIEVKVS